MAASLHRMDKSEGCSHRAQRMVIGVRGASGAYWKYQITQPRLIDARGPPNCGKYTKRTLFAILGICSYGGMGGRGEPNTYNILYLHIY